MKLLLVTLLFAISYAQTVNDASSDVNGTSDSSGDTGTTTTTTTLSPTNDPSAHPATTTTTLSPTNDPSPPPSVNPTYNPTSDPSSTPTCTPSSTPTFIPSSSSPTLFPSSSPTFSPSSNPTTTSPSDFPSTYPSSAPSQSPTSSMPSRAPSENPVDPSYAPTSRDILATYTMVGRYDMNAVFKIQDKMLSIFRDTAQMTSADEVIVSVSPTTVQYQVRSLTNYTILMNDSVFQNRLKRTLSLNKDVRTVLGLGELQPVFCNTLKQQRYCWGYACDSEETGKGGKCPKMRISEKTSLCMWNPLTGSCVSSSEVELPERESKGELPEIRPNGKYEGGDTGEKIPSNNKPFGGRKAEDYCPTLSKANCKGACSWMYGSGCQEIDLMRPKAHSAVEHDSTNHLNYTLVTVAVVLSMITMMVYLAFKKRHLRTQGNDNDDYLIRLDTHYQ